MLCSIETNKWLLRLIAEAKLKCLRNFKPHLLHTPYKAREIIAIQKNRTSKKKNPKQEKHNFLLLWIFESEASLYALCGIHMNLARMKKEEEWSWKYVPALLIVCLKQEVAGEKSLKNIRTGYYQWKYESIFFWRVCLWKLKFLYSSRHFPNTNCEMIWLVRHLENVFSTAATMLLLWVK